MTYVRNALGDPLPCCWDDCAFAGHDEHHEDVREDGAMVRYIFCGDRHRRYWLNAHRHYGNLPSGSRTPLGLIIR